MSDEFEEYRQADFGPRRGFVTLPAGQDFPAPGFAGIGPDGKLYPFCAVNAYTFPPGWVMLDKPEHVELPDGTHEVRYRFVMLPPGVDRETAERVMRETDPPRTLWEGDVATVKIIEPEDGRIADCCPTNVQREVVRWWKANRGDGPEADGYAIEIGRPDPWRLNVRVCPFCGRDLDGR
jgi:hypothetical protein